MTTPKYQKSTAQYSADYGLSPRTIQRYMKAGLPLDDPKKLRETIGGQKHVAVHLGNKDKTALQIRKLTAECVRMERENAVKSGELISLAEYMEINARIDAEICKGLDELPVELAPKVFGLKTIAEVTLKLREGTDRVKAALYAPVREPQKS